MSDSEFWKYLHDGSIERIDGAVPGTVEVVVSIPYLRERFAGEGAGFRITLFDCTRFEYEAYGEPVCRDLADIARRDLELLSLGSCLPIVVNCVMGRLSLEYSASSLALDTGEPISASQLAKASAGYWEEWSKPSRSEA